jgi:hypothetical protein
MALAGLFLLVFGTVYPSQKVSELELKRAATQTERSVLLIQAAALKDDVAIAKKSPPPTEALVTRLAERLVDLEVKQAQITGKEAEEKVLTQDLMFAWRTLKVGVVLGAILSFVGFVCWYFRVQKPQDKLLQNQLASKPDA